MKCLHCGDQTPRLTRDQRYCPPCAAEVARIVEADAKRRTPRWSISKDLTGMAGAL